MNKQALWQRLVENTCVCDEVGLSLDVSRMRFGDGFFDEIAPVAQRAFDAMAGLEAGEIANPDEGRMVGHYWLRNAKLAPDAAITQAVADCVAKIKRFATDVHSGRIATPDGGAFKQFLLVGIGGSALGPQFVDDALGSSRQPMRAHFCDNTDPDGIDRVLSVLSGKLAQTMVVVISKSGGTKETRNGMLEVARAYEAAGVPFAKCTVAITSDGSALYDVARKQGWLATFPMWDWVGGRTSQTSAVGLLPAALAGFDIDALLAGASTMDEATRVRDVRRNPAALLAAMWYDAARNRHLRDMVVIPYKDRLALFSRYLQQLIMESLGKELDLAGNVVHEGITVYGNKGSTDQHAYVQQLREGLHNFYVTFIEVLRDRAGESIEVEPGVTSGDFLSGFLLGTREALYEKGRESMTITIERVDERAVGSLIALFERAVGFYASTVGINAYHQPGVEAGKKAAGAVIALQAKLIDALRARTGEALSAEEAAATGGCPDDAEWAYKILEHLAANPARGIQRTGKPGPATARYGVGAVHT